MCLVCVHGTARLTNERVGGVVPTGADPQLVILNTTLERERKRKRERERARERERERGKRVKTLMVALGL